MGKYSIDCVGYPYWDYDSDAFEVFDEENGHSGFSISSLIKAASGIHSPASFVYKDVELEDSRAKNTDDYVEPYNAEEDIWEEYLMHLSWWREKTGEKYPPVFKVSISVEAEPLSSDELEKFWENRKRINNERYKDYDNSQLKIDLSMNDIKEEYR